jgi:hypothetical protein
VCVRLLFRPVGLLTRGTLGDVPPRAEFYAARYGAKRAQAHEARYPDQSSVNIKPIMIMLNP